MVNESRSQRMEQTESPVQVVRLADIAPGTRVTDANGVTGAVIGAAQAETTAGSGVQVAWEDGDRTVVPLHDLTWRGDILVVRAEALTATTSETAEGAMAVRGADRTNGETLTIPYRGATDC